MFCLHLNHFCLAFMSAVIFPGCSNFCFLLSVISIAFGYTVRKACVQSALNKTVSRAFWHFYLSSQWKLNKFNWKVVFNNSFSLSIINFIYMLYFNFISSHVFFESVNFDLIWSSWKMLSSMNFSSEPLQK